MTFTIYCWKIRDLCSKGFYLLQMHFLLKNTLNNSNKASKIVKLNIEEKSKR